MKESIILATGDGACRMELLPLHGGICHSLVLRGGDGRSREVLAGGGPGELPDNPWYRGVVLWPFPSRLQGGSYQFQGGSYQLPLNEPATGNSLHGFLTQLRFRVARREEGRHEAALVLAYDYDGGLPGYPFPAEIRVAYLLNSSFGLTLEMSVRNLHDGPVPVGVGWHPYLTLGQPVDELLLQLPPVSRLEMDERLLPTGRKLPFQDFESLAPIGGRALDCCLRIDSPRRAWVSATLYSPAQERGLELWQERLPAREGAAGEGFGYLLAFIPPDRQSIALEPVSCGIDAFNTGEGLVLLEAGREFALRCGLRPT